MLLVRPYTRQIIQQKRDELLPEGRLSLKTLKMMILRDTMVGLGFEEDIAGSCRKLTRLWENACDDVFFYSNAERE